MEVIGQLQDQAALPRGTGRRYQLSKSMVGTQSRFGRSTDEINILFMPGFELRFFLSIVTVPTALRRRPNCRFVQQECELYGLCQAFLCV